MFNYKYNYSFVGSEYFELEMEKLKFSVPVQKGDNIRITPKDQDYLPISHQKTYYFIVDNVTHLVGADSILLLRLDKNMSENIEK